MQIEDAARDRNSVNTSFWFTLPEVRIFGECFEHIRGNRNRLARVQLAQKHFKNNCYFFENVFQLQVYFWVIVCKRFYTIFKANLSEKPKNT